MACKYFLDCTRHLIILIKGIVRYKDNITISISTGIFSTYYLCLLIKVMY